MESKSSAEEKKMNHLVVRVGATVSALSILTFVWTSMIQPILTLQNQIQLANYRINQLEKVVEALNSELGNRPRNQSYHSSEELEADIEKTP